MIFGFQKSNEIINYIQNKTGHECPQDILKVNEWCRKVIKSLLPISVKSIIENKEIIKSFEKKSLSGAFEKRISPSWVGEPSPFFHQNTRTLPSHTIRTENLSFYKLKDVYAFRFYDFGPIVLSNTHEVIPELSSPFFPLLILVENDFFQNAQKIEQVTFGLNDRFTESNFAHILLDNIPRILGSVIFEEKKPSFLCYEVTNKWQKDLYSNYSILPENQIILKKNKIFFFENLILASDFGSQVQHPSCKTNRKCISFIRSKMNFSNEFVDVLVIERNDSRCLINQQELIDKLKTLNLKVRVIDCLELSFIEQIGAFQNANYVIGTHGAALASSVFMKKGSTLFELLPPSYCNPEFWMITSSIDVNYFGVTEIKEDNLDKRPRYRNVEISKNSIDKIFNIIQASKKLS